MDTNEHEYLNQTLHGPVSGLFIRVYSCPWVVKRNSLS